MKNQTASCATRIVASVWSHFGANFPFFRLSPFPGGAKIHFSAIFSHFGPLVCTGQSVAVLVRIPLQ